MTAMTFTIWRAIRGDVAGEREAVQTFTGTRKALGKRVQALTWDNPGFVYWAD